MRKVKGVAHFIDMLLQIFDRAIKGGRKVAGKETVTVSPPPTGPGDLVGLPLDLSHSATRATASVSY